MRPVADGSGVLAKSERAASRRVLTGSRALQACASCDQQRQQAAGIASAGPRRPDPGTQDRDVHVSAQK